MKKQKQKNKYLVINYKSFLSFIIVSFLMVNTQVRKYKMYEMCGQAEKSASWK